MKNLKLKNMVLSAMFLGIGLVLPFLTGQLKQLGNMLLPMHIPVLLCGLICGFKYGLVVGFITPVLRSILFSMPIMYPTAISMAFELATYGFVSGFLYSRSKWHCIKALYKCMLISMLAGRIVWGLTQAILLGVGQSSFTLSAFFTGAVINAIPGIIIQLIVIPAIMVSLKKSKLVPLTRKHNKESIKK